MLLACVLNNSKIQAPYAESCSIVKKENESWKLQSILTSWAFEGQRPVSTIWSKNSIDFSELIVNCVIQYTQ